MILNRRIPPLAPPALGQTSINNAETTLRGRKEQPLEARHSSCDVSIVQAQNVLKRDRSVQTGFTRVKDGQPAQSMEDADLADAPPACVALVPVLQSVQWSSIQPLPRPGSCFLTQLIATAEQAPQTRTLRRATAADAQTAYAASRHPTRGAGLRTQHIV